MKIDKKNPRHWFYLALSAFNVFMALVLRALPGQHPVKRVLLYGHKLSGNLLPLYKALSGPEHPDIQVHFLALDPAYHTKLRQDGIASVCAISPGSARILAGTDAIITDHGLHTLAPLLWLTKIKFIDVWHGIPFKGFDETDFRVQHCYNEIWVASPLLAKIYTEQYGFEPGRIRITGYARTDMLIEPPADRLTIKRKLGIPCASNDRLVLFAPTWRQDAASRSIYPFGLDQHTFLRTLQDISRRTRGTIAIRTHLNSPQDLRIQGQYDGLVFLPASDFPNTEEILLATDILVCDWSSIAFDFLLLSRPTIFLDVDPPFSKGFSLGPEFRFGPLANDMHILTGLLETYLRDPSEFDNQYGAQVQAVRESVYGGYADGHAAFRCMNRLRSELGILDRLPI